MQVYLPIAEMSVNALVYLGLGAAVGFLSGVFGVGGGFLLTPLLILLGIPPIVVVGTGAAYIVASSISGAVTQYQRGNVDLKMALVMLAGGLLGTLIGVDIVSLLQRRGQFDLALALSYVVFFSVIASLMLVESLNERRSRPVVKPQRAPHSGHHSWVDGLPFKMRFHRSKLYISAIAPAVIGMFVGVMAGAMGIGGGFIVIPAMIYLLRMPAAVVVGTSIFQIAGVGAFALVLHVMRNHNVDFLLAALGTDR